MYDKPALVVLAAGMGTRFGGLKQLAPAGPNGEALLDYSVHDAWQAGFGKVVFVIKRDIEQAFRDRVLEHMPTSVEVRTVFQEEACDGLPGDRQLWGTGHAVLAAADVVTEPFAVINADDYYGPQAYMASVERFRSLDGAGRYFLVSYELGATLSPFGPVSRGICRLTGNDLREVTEYTRLVAGKEGVDSLDDDDVAGTFAPATPASMNFWGFTPGVFAQLERLFSEFIDTPATGREKEFYLSAAVNRLVQSQAATVEVIPAGKDWFGVTYPDDLERVRSRISGMIDDDRYPHCLWQQHG